VADVPGHRGDRTDRLVVNAARRGLMQQSALSPVYFCSVEPDRERVVVRVGGELDLSVAADVGARIGELLDAGLGRIVVDLSGVTFIDSAGIHMLVAAQRTAERDDAALSLVAVPLRVRRVLDLTGAASLLAIDAAGVPA
jgi:anti-sigma B factor antagonist